MVQVPFIEEIKIVAASIAAEDHNILPSFILDIAVVVGSTSSTSLGY